jgi:hypothetical protein
MATRINTFESCFECRYHDGRALYCNISHRKLTEAEEQHTPEWCRFPKRLSYSKCDGYDIIKIESGKKIKSY